MAQLLPTRQTKPTSLDEIARHVVRPAGIVSTGWPAVRDKCASFGVEFDDWQTEAGRLILAKRADGIYACSIGGAVMSIPRQVGKTYFVGATVFALCLLTPNTTALWTAHRLRTGNETFAKMKSFAERKLVAPYVQQIYVGSGTGEIVFTNGSRILFGARERGFGRGFDDVDIEVFDEAQILGENAIDDMLPATNTAANPLLFFIGTPPKPKDPSEVYTRKRDEALSGADTDTMYLEFSADPDCADPSDRDQWAKANPSYPNRTPAAAMARMQKNLTVESFLREALGIWDAVDTVGAGPIPLAAWELLTEATSTPTGTGVRWALDVAHDRRWSTFGLAGPRSDGNIHVEMTAALPGVNSVAIAARAKEMQDKLGGIPLTIGVSTPAHSLVDDLEAAGVTVDLMKPGEQALAFASFCDQVSGVAPTIRHRGEPLLAKAVAFARTKPWADGGETLTRRGSVGDVSPFSAALMAFGRLGTVEAPKTAAAHVVFA
jgi:phage terminase large subunit-like protein